MSDPLESMTVKRMWRNTQCAMKNWAATEDPERPTLDDLRAWHLPAETAQRWFANDLLTLDEFEGLLDLILAR